MEVSTTKWCDTAHPGFRIAWFAVKFSELWKGDVVPGPYVLIRSKFSRR